VAIANNSLFWLIGVIHINTTICYHDSIEGISVIDFVFPGFLNCLGSQRNRIPLKSKVSYENVHNISISTSINKNKIKIKANNMLA
jgi:hypothetical protein